MKRFGNYTGVLALACAVPVFSPVSFATSTGEQLALCKEAITTTFGQGTRVNMYGTKSYKGILTLKLKVTPENGSPVTLQCSEDAEAEQRVVLKNKEGETLVT